MWGGGEPDVFKPKKGFPKLCNKFQKSWCERTKDSPIRDSNSRTIRSQLHSLPKKQFDAVIHHTYPNNNPPPTRKRHVCLKTSRVWLDDRINVVRAWNRDHVLWTVWCDGTATTVRARWQDGWWKTSALLVGILLLCTGAHHRHVGWHVIDCWQLIWPAREDKWKTNKQSANISHQMASLYKTKLRPCETLELLHLMSVFDKMTH